MRPDIRAVFRSVAFVSAASPAICAIFVAVAQGLTAAFFSFVLHTNRTRLTRGSTWENFFGGGLLFSLVTALLGSAIARCYGRLPGHWLEPQGTSPRP